MMNSLTLSCLGKIREGNGHLNILRENNVMDKDHNKPPQEAERLPIR